ncbi:SPARC-related modular calcium-binding protein 1-like [Myxocyprinus asiaticus]|uniref:SPARC-related modular calcium-binding protein 1-like n=1 Tax=Myxocyprinus asiaticus TaxID=70543 RepID=UPI0022216759|nr:SPARC-related modular calcium-binding protein 1-like [Myxocyprinus asiaticus]
MLSLMFACRVLLIVLMSDSVQTANKSQLLVSDNLWPQACALDCTRGRHRAVCGSNGQMYKSLCAFQRAQCINNQLTTAARSVCTDALSSKCQLARSQALRASARSDSFAIFIPECKADGTYAEVQCHNQTGYCWCSTPDGIPVSRSSVLHLQPNCTGQISDNAQETDVESAQAKRGIHWRSSPDPEQRPLQTPTGVTAPPFWVTIQLNSDPKGNRSLRRPKDTLKTCNHERTTVLAEMALQWSEERFIPECSADGRYKTVQCHSSTGYCWCVRVDSGRPIPGTSTRVYLHETVKEGCKRLLYQINVLIWLITLVCYRNQMPDCSRQETHTVIVNNSYTQTSLSGCPSVQKTDFLQNLIQEFQQDVEKGGLSPTHRTTEDRPPVSTSSPSPSLHLSFPVRALQWYFARLDRDANGILNEHETRPLRILLRKTLHPRRCAKKFMQFCDKNADRGLSALELSSCITI